MLSFLKAFWCIVSCSIPVYQFLCISSICFQGLLHLRDIDLSYNDITDVEDFPYKLGAISSLNLAGNRLRDVKGTSVDGIRFF